MTTLTHRLAEACKRALAESDDVPAGFNPKGDTWYAQMSALLAEYDAIKAGPRVGDRIRIVGVKTQHDYYTNGREGVLRRQDGAYWWADMEGFDYTHGCQLVPFEFGSWEVIDRPSVERIA